jgi:excisionase family DNA binding protein
VTKGSIPPELIPFLDALAELLANHVAEKVIERLPQQVQAHADAPKKRQYMTTKQAAEELGLGTSTLEIWRTKGTGPKWIKVGRAIRYSRGDLEAWVAARRKGT